VPEVKDGRNPELTAEDRAELTAFNLLVHSLMRETSEEIQPCWLAMSPEARAEGREAGRLFVDKHSGMGFGTMPLETAERITIEAFDSSLVEKFIEAEAEYKRLRAEGNPRAFFAE
jgi:hypothetical protein